MSSPTFFHELPIEIKQQLTEEEMEQIHKAEKLYWETKPKTKYPLALEGAVTRQGGVVHASCHKVKVTNLSIARVGDNVVYPDGSISKIISGAGSACKIDGISIALVGSRLENGDEIIETPDSRALILIYHDMKKPDGFLSHD